MTLTAQNNTAARIAGCPHLQLTDSCTAFPDRVNESALPIVSVTNELCSATIALQGAQLLTFEQISDPSGLSKDTSVPSNNTSLLWLSPTAIFKTGKAIRGGIPICLPWFGPHATDPSKPQHGFARNNDWQLADAQALESGATQLTWEFHATPSAYPDLCEGAFFAQLVMTLGLNIDLALSVHNTGDADLPISWALHSYHPVDHLEHARVIGLDGCEYLDNTQQKARKTQVGDIRFTAEVDRVYVSVPASQELVTDSQRFMITGHDCNSSIIWNPGAELAASMTDVGEANHQGFVCVERGNTADNLVLLRPSQQHSAKILIQRCKPL